jgi:hypothetical protein
MNNSTMIRVKRDDRKIWKEYCETLGENSPNLFNKIIKSSEIKLQERILTELKKKQEKIMGRRN